MIGNEVQVHYLGVTVSSHVAEIIWQRDNFLQLPILSKSIIIVGQCNRESDMMVQHGIVNYLYLHEK